MRSYALDVRLTAQCCCAAAVILMTTLSCDSNGPESVTEAPAESIAPIMRGQMVFVDQSGPYYSIFLADSNGVKLKNLSAGSADFDPAVSADGKRIAFSSHLRSEDGLDIWVMNADGTNQIRLTHTVSATSPTSSTSPAWSPDGRRIAFVTSRGGLWEHRIFVMNADGSDIKQITDDDMDSIAPEWSLDGSRILFSRPSGRQGDAGIFEMDPDGSNIRRLHNGGGYPTRSPDGTRIAFSAGSLFVMDSDGSNAKALTSGVDWDGGKVTWSPDGKSIVFGITSNSKICVDWDYEDYACGRDLKRIGLDGVVDPAWEVLSAFSPVWQR